MTKAIGTITLAAPCCGARYVYPRYMSMNFMAWAHWTDGWRDHSLMPNDEGLRRCMCGQFFLLKNMKAVEEGGSAEGEDLPRTIAVPDEQLPECFSKPVSAEVEVVARLGYWRYPESVTPIAADLESHRIHLHKGRFPVLAPDLSFNA